VKLKWETLELSEEWSLEYAVVDGPKILSFMLHKLCDDGVISLKRDIPKGCPVCGTKVSSEAIESLNYVLPKGDY